MNKSESKIEELAQEPERWTKYIKARCRECPECGEQWEWTHSRSDGGASMIARIQQTTVNVRRLMYRLKTGKLPQSARTVSCTCPNPDCLNPDRLVQLTKAQVVQRTAKTGKLHTQAMRAKMSKSKTKNSRITHDMVLQIRQDMRSSYVAAPEYGISPAHFRSIRNGESRKDWTANPFSWLLAA